MRSDCYNNAKRSPKTLFFYVTELRIVKKGPPKHFHVVLSNTIPFKMITDRLVFISN